MAKTSEYQRAIISCLEDEYGATNVRLSHGANHPYLTFYYPNTESTSKWRLTLNNTVHSLTGLNLKKQDIRRMLGPSPEKTSTQPKRTLEEMTAAVSVSPFNPLPIKTSENKRFDIKVACYKGGDKGNRLRFFFPEELVGLIGCKIGDALKTEMIDSDNWKLIPSKQNSPKLSRYKHSSITNLSLDSGYQLTTNNAPFGITPGEAIIVDGAIMARVFPEQKRDVIQRKKRVFKKKGIVKENTLIEVPLVLPPATIPSGAIGRAINAGPFVPDASRFLPVAMDMEVPPSKEEIRSCLEMVRRIYRTTDFKLTHGKDQEGNSIIRFTASIE